MHYFEEQKEKDKTLAPLHTDFLPVLQVLLHTAIECLGVPDDTASAETQLFECQSSTQDLCHLSLRFFSKKSLAASP